MESYNIVFATDENYIQHLGVSIKSLLYNNVDLSFKIYIINNKLSNKSFEKIRKITSIYNCELVNAKISDDVFSNLLINNHFTKAMYYRLLIPNYVSETKVLYLDADIIVNNSIKTLYNKNIESCYVAAVENPGFTRHKDLSMKNNSAYFNSGVLLINVSFWKENELQKHVVNFIDTNSTSILYPDQDGLNACIDGNWKILSPKYNQQSVLFENNNKQKYNYYSDEEINEAIEDPVIIHYTGSSKPWHLRNKHPFKKAYWKYLIKTPFFLPFILNFFISYYKTVFDK
jgi:lipopolysaccharide biosynthesis glycosyltransferase